MPLLKAEGAYQERSDVVDTAEGGTTGDLGEGRLDMVADRVGGGRGSGVYSVPPLKPPVRPGTSSTSIASVENDRTGGLATEPEGLTVPLEVSTGSMLFRKSSTVFVCTRAVALALPMEDATGVTVSEDCDSTLEVEFCCFILRDSLTAFRANNSALRCCSRSKSAGSGVEGALELLGMKGSALADRDGDF